MADSVEDASVVVSRGSSDGKVLYSGTMRRFLQRVEGRERSERREDC